MEKLLRSLAWYADTVLSICYPAPVPPVVEEEVRSGFNEMTFTQPDDEIGGSGRVDLRSTSAAPSVADSPGSVAPPADPGQPHPNDASYEAIRELQKAFWCFRHKTVAGDCGCPAPPLTKELRCIFCGADHGK